jgi:hypothetical protein
MGTSFHGNGKDAARALQKPTTRLQVKSDVVQPNFDLGSVLGEFRKASRVLQGNRFGAIMEQKLERAIMPWFHAAFSGGSHDPTNPLHEAQVLYAQSVSELLPS